MKGEEKDFENTSTKNNRYIKKSMFKLRKNTKPDYVLFRTKNNTIKSITHKVIKHPEFSDHYAILSKIII